MNWHDHFSYDPATGVLSWKERARHLFQTDGAWKTANKVWAGRAIASTDKDGYLVARIRGKHLYAHRIIWEMHYGPLARGMEVDHRDGRKTNNVLSNLRQATRSQNKWNSLRMRRKGSYMSKRTGKHEARIRVNGKETRLGGFVTEAEAHEAYRQASLKIHGEFSPYHEPNP